MAEIVCHPAHERTAVVIAAGRKIGHIRCRDYAQPKTFVAVLLDGRTLETSSTYVEALKKLAAAANASAASN